MSDTVIIPRDAARKVARAEYHINDLNGKIEAYFADSPMKVVKRFDPETGIFSIATKTDKPIPDEFAVIIGDAVHNLRAALDMGYFAIISRFTDREDNIQYPLWALGGNRKESVLGRRLIQLAPKDVLAAVERSEPYPGGKNHIYELDALDVRDKHRLAILTGRATSLTGDAIGLMLPLGAQKVSGAGTLTHVGKGENIFFTWLPFNHPLRQRGAFEDHVGVNSPFDILFADGPFENRAIVPTLVTLVSSVRDTVADIWRASGLTE